MKTQSLEATMRSLLPTTLLFRHLKIEPTSDINSVKFIGCVYNNHDGDTEAVARLLRLLDNELFFGDSDIDPRTINGVSKLIQESLRLGTGSDIYGSEEKFFDRFEADKEKKALRLFNPLQAAPIGEGDLPPTNGATFAIGQGALVWRQLMPMTTIPLAAMREGKLAISLGHEQPTFKHETSTEIPRSAALLYGTLEMVDPSAVFMMPGYRL